MKVRFYNKVINRWFNRDLNGKEILVQIEYSYIEFELQEEIGEWVLTKDGEGCMRVETKDNTYLIWLNR